MPGIQRYPENADKVIFAEDFMNHILLRFKLPLLSTGIANYRALVYNGFNSEVKLAADYVCRSLEEEMSEEFENILKQNPTIGITHYVKYAVSLKSRAFVFPSELGARNLMRFCVKVSTAAAKFYMHGILEVPVFAVQSIIMNIISEIDMVRGGWVALNMAAAGYAQNFIEMDNYLTPKSSSDNDWESESLSSTLSSKNSEGSRSPDHEMDCGDSQDEHPEELSDSDYCNLSTAALNSLAEEPLSSISDSGRVEKTDDVKAGNIVNFSGNISDSLSSGSSKRNHSSDSFYSFEVTSSEDDGTRHKIRKKQNKKPSYSRSKESESDSDTCETDLRTKDFMDPSDRQLTEKRLAILSSPANELHESDLAHHFKTSSSDSFTSEDTNKSLMEEEDRVQSSYAESSPKKPVPKRR